MDVEWKRYATVELKPGNRGIRAAFERSSALKWIVNILVVGAACLLLADGVLTPAQSVLGAIQGASSDPCVRHETRLTLLFSLREKGLLLSRPTFQLPPSSG
jgi:K+ potassium transporter